MITFGELTYCEDPKVQLETAPRWGVPVLRDGYAWGTVYTHVTMPGRHAGSPDGVYAPWGNRYNPAFPSAQIIINDSRGIRSGNHDTGLELWVYPQAVLKTLRALDRMIS